MPSATFKSKMSLGEAQELADQLVRAFIDLGMRRAEVCGSVRRRKPVVGDIDIVVDGPLSILREPNRHILVLHGLLPWSWVDGGEKKCTLSYHGRQVNVLRSDEEHWGAAMFYFTGPHAYGIAYRVRAKRMGMLLNDKGLWRGTTCLASRTEKDIYEALGKEYKDPRERGK